MRERIVVEFRLSAKRFEGIKRLERANLEYEVLIIVWRYPVSNIPSFLLLTM
jgi:hypothetical protein